MRFYFCYRKIPAIRCVGCTFPAYKEMLTYKKWVKQGKPTDDSIVFIGQNGRPPQLAKYWEERKNKEEAKKCQN